MSKSKKPLKHTPDPYLEGIMKHTRKAQEPQTAFDQWWISIQNDNRLLGSWPNKELARAAWSAGMKESNRLWMEESSGDN